MPKSIHPFAKNASHGEKDGEKRDIQALEWMGRNSLCIRPLWGAETVIDKNGSPQRLGP